MSQKSTKRFSHSRLGTFKNCPKRHGYEYIEQIPTPGNVYTLAGGLFHKAIQEVYETSILKDTLKEWEAACSSGKMDLPNDLLSSIVTTYFNHYADELKHIKIIAIEKEVIQKLGKGETFVMKADMIYEDVNGYIVLRDTKTTLNSLKQHRKDLTRDPQLLSYVTMLEEEMNITIDAVEIDEVKLEKIADQVPITSKGVPTIDRNALSNVTYEMYINKLQEMNLHNNPRYKDVIEFLEHRGHPLFRRYRQQILDRNFLEENKSDVIQTYEAIKKGFNYRIQGPLCNYCPFKELCDLEYSDPDEQSRNMALENIKRK